MRFKSYWSLICWILQHEFQSWQFLFFLACNKFLQTYIFDLGKKIMTFVETEHRMELTLNQIKLTIKY